MGGLTAVSLLVAGSVPLSAAPAPLSTKIAFRAGRDASFEIYSMNADGTNQLNLTRNPASDADPSWSPDGTKIAFTRVNSDNSGSNVYVMNADGTHQVNLTNQATGGNDQPDWSPDGTRIAFRADRDTSFEIYSMNADGTNQVNLTRNPTFDADPSWSPDGTKIAFTRGVLGLNVYVMNADGTNPVNLTNQATGVNDQPDWSPDGTKIAFRTARDNNFEIYAMNADGTNQVNLTRAGSAGDEEPSWSPDGTKIAFTKSVLGPNVYVMNADGTNPLSLTTPANGNSDQPDWSQPRFDLLRPTCRIVRSGTSTRVTFEDNESGLQVIRVLDTRNATAAVPRFSPGTNDPVTVSLKRIDATRPGSVRLRARDGGALPNLTYCTISGYVAV